MSAPVRKEGNLPRPERADIILRGYRRGDSIPDIARALSKTNQYSGGALPVIRNVLSNPKMFDPHIDEVAIERAFHGDRVAWNAMTYYERAALTDLVIERTNQGATNSAWPGHSAMREGTGSERDQGWTYLLAQRLGMPSNRFHEIKQKRASAIRQKNKAAKGVENGQPSS